MSEKEELIEELTGEIVRAVVEHMRREDDDDEADCKFVCDDCESCEHQDECLSEYRQNMFEATVDSHLALFTAFCIIFHDGQTTKEAFADFVHTIGE